MNNIGCKSYDIRDFFDETFVQEYKEVVIEYRNILDTNLPTAKNDGNSTNNTDLIKWIEEHTDKDFSYLYNKGQKEYQYDYKFVTTTYEYLDSINVDETYNIDYQPVNQIIPNISSLGLMYDPPQNKTSPYYFMTDKINEVCLKKLIEEFPYMCNSLDDIRWNTNEWFGHMIAMPKGAFMSFHRDNTADRPFTLLNYVNVDITLEDGGVYRYYIPKDIKNFSPPGGSEINKKTGYREGFLNTKFDQYDIVTNYTKVNIMLHLNHKTKEEDKKYFGLEIPPLSGYTGALGIPHLVTKNKSDEVRYTLYRRVVWRDS